MENDLTKKSEHSSDKRTDLYMHKKLVMEKIFKSDVYKEFISQWNDPDTRALVMDGIGIRKKL